MLMFVKYERFKILISKEWFYHILRSQIRHDNFLKKFYKNFNFCSSIENNERKTNGNQDGPLYDTLA